MFRSFWFTATISQHCQRAFASPAPEAARSNHADPSFGPPVGSRIETLYPRLVGLTIGKHSRQDSNLIKQSRLSLIASSRPLSARPMGRRRPGRWLAPFRPGRRIGESGQMLTSTECHEIAKQKLVQAEHEPQHRTRLLTAAQGWLVLENELRRSEANVIPPKASRRSRPTSVGGATRSAAGDNKRIHGRR